MVAASHLTSIMFWNKKITMCTFFLLTHCILHDLHIYYEIHEILRYNLGSRNPNTEEYDYRWIKCSILGIPSTMENTRIWQKLLLWWPKRNLHELVSWLETRVWTEKIIIPCTSTPQGNYNMRLKIILNLDWFPPCITNGTNPPNMGGFILEAIGLSLKSKGSHK